MKHYRLMKGALIAKAIASRRKSSLYDVLRKVDLFAGLQKKYLTQILKIAYVREYDQEELIFRKGDPSYGLYVILKGTVDIYLKKDGQEWTLASLNEGEYFGEIAFSKRAVRSANCMAKKPAKLLYIFIPDLKRVFRRYPDMGFTIYENVVEKMWSFLEFAEEEYLRLQEEKND